MAPVLGRRFGMRDCFRSPPPSMLLEVLPAPLLDFGSWYMSSLNVYPIQTKILTAAALAMTGDLIAQSVEPGQYDSKRGLSFGLFDAIYRGGFQHFLFPIINDAFHGTLLLQLVPTGDVALLAALERTVANQLVVVPLVYYPLFFSLTGIVQGLTVDETYARGKEKFFPLIQRNLQFWLPVQIIQFEFVPEELQVTWVAAFGLVWKIILSTIAGNAKADIACASDAEECLLHSAATVACATDAESKILKN
eukprot:CAMPEP_0119318556 /NCGR_PEP_ID=MMETSP1333-20130426/46757_1 /TAXON_ID=418940 /ORGANISM="Scyphosphaera apsteinii, Strain RCC1455" /LENGTH=249 /DNA_ID=CAMNT_0007324757 /DNA_START=129 /DNA_END=878 /DNA_ORIENTATION=+